MNISKSFVAFSGWTAQLGALLLAVAVLPQAHAIDVQVSATYTSISSPTYTPYFGIQVDGTQNRSFGAGTQTTPTWVVPLDLHSPTALPVEISEIRTYRLQLTAPAGYAVIIENVQRSVYNDSSYGGYETKTLYVTLIRAVDNGADAPIGNASSILTRPPRSPYATEGDHIPYVRFNLGRGLNGAAYIPLEIPLYPRNSDSYELPIAVEGGIDCQPSNGGFILTSPNARCELTIDTPPSGTPVTGAFYVKFYAPGSATSFVAYHFEFPTWTGTSRVGKVTKTYASGGPTYVTQLSGLITGLGIDSGADGTFTWDIDDWHDSSSGAVRTFHGQRTVSHNWPTSPTFDFILDGTYSDIIEVKENGVLISKTKQDYREYCTVRNDESDMPFIATTNIQPTNSTLGYGGTNPISTQTLYYKNSQATLGTVDSTGRTHFDSGDVSKKLAYDTWLDESPTYYTGAFEPSINESGCLVTVTVPEGPFDLPSWIRRRVGTTILSEATIVNSNETVYGASASNVLVATRYDFVAARTGSNGDTTPRSTTDSNAILSVRKWFRPDLTGDQAYLRDRVYSVQEPGGAKTSYGYQLGTFTYSSGTTSFTTSSSGTDVRVYVLRGATSGGNAVTGIGTLAFDPISLVANRSTETIEYYQRGRLVHRENYVYTSGQATSPSFTLLNSEHYDYTVDGRLTDSVAANGATYHANWTGNRKTSEKDDTGITTDFTYDVVDRVATAATSAVGSVPAMRMAYAYPASANEQSTTVGPDKTLFPQAEQLTTTTAFDTAMRRTKVSGNGLTTDYAYSNGGRTVQETYNSTTADAATKTTDRYQDGRIKSITGNAVIAQNYDYGFDSSGRFYLTEKIAGTENRNRTTYYDLAGRPVEERVNSFGSTTKPIVTLRSYKTDADNHRDYNLLEKVRVVLKDNSNATFELALAADQLTTYDSFGEITASGADIDGDGALKAGTTGIDGVDRMTEVATIITSNNGQWWQKSTQRTYHTDKSTEVNTSQTWTQLSGLSSAARSNVIVYDYFGAATQATTSVDTTTHTVTSSISRADGTQSVAISTAGLVTLSKSLDSTGAVVTSETYGYDQYGRRTGVIDSRKGASESTTYWPGTTHAYQQFDANGKRIATYTYDGAARVQSITDANDKITYTRYNTRGQQVQRWGDNVYPVDYVYSAYGELKELWTYRTDPSTTPDKTIWDFDEYTGLLKAKKDPQNANAPTTHQVSYTYEYGSGFKTVTRTWARGAKTTYHYSLATAELMDVAYDDDTAPVTYHYARDGQLKQVDDATGTRDLVYDRGQLASEGLSTSYFNSLVLSTTAESASSTTAHTVAGRYNGFKLGTTSTPDAEMSMTFAYDAAGRIGTANVSYPAQQSRSAVSVDTTYHYAPNSDLWDSFTQGSFKLAREFEPKRDIVQTVTGSYGTTTLAKYTYGVDDSGRLKSTLQDGAAYNDFSDKTYFKYDYDSRGALKTATGYLGSDPSATSALQPLAGRAFGYTYDAAGNRATVSVDTETVHYTDGQGHDGGNLLNQVMQRSSLQVHVSGTAATAATVTVSGTTITKTGTYWDAAIPITTAGQNASVDVKATYGSNSDSKTVHALQRPASETFVYDDDGNLKDDGQWHYEWDGENRLKSMATSATAAAWGAPNRSLTFTYDYLGRRVRKKSTEVGVGTVDRKYIYSNWQLIAELDPDTSKIVKSYAWGLDASGGIGTGVPGGLLLTAMHSATAVATVHAISDGRGNVTSLVRDGSTAGTYAFAATYEYDPFGQLLRTDGDLGRDNPIGYSSEFTDRETGLLYYGNRYYDPSLGRFINRDPAEEVGGENLYRFVNNSPTNAWDLLGLGPKNQPDNGNASDVLTGDQIRKMWKSDGNGGWDLELNGKQIHVNSDGGVSWSDGNSWRDWGMVVSARSDDDPWVQDGIDTRNSTGHDEASDRKQRETRFEGDRRPTQEDEPLVEVGRIGWYKTRDEAAIAVLKIINPISIRLNRELGGKLIKRKSDGMYSYTAPRLGDLHSVSTNRIPIPKGKDYVWVGDYHAHANYADDYGNVVAAEYDVWGSDHFSRADMRESDALWNLDKQYPAGLKPEDWRAGYLGTPSGKFRRYIPGNDKFGVVVYDPNIDGP